MSVIDRQKIAGSVIAVPPLARRNDLTLDVEANQRIIEYLEGGGVRTLLYGGNANFYHLRPSEYAQLLEMLQASAALDTWVIPSVGPAYGAMMDQAEVLRDFRFPTAMVLPHRDLATPAGIARGIRDFVAAAGLPVMLYIKHDGWIDVPTVRLLVEDGLVALIKYAIVREEPAQDDYLRELVDSVDPGIIVSGIGEQPAIVHLRDFGLAGFTSGCVCVAPGLSMRMLRHLKAAEYAAADAVREQFAPLEDLRNRIHPIRVLHAAVEAAEIAATGPILPLLSDVSAAERAEIAEAARALRAREASVVV